MTCVKRYMVCRISAKIHSLTAGYPFPWHMVALYMLTVISWPTSYLLLWNVKVHHRVHKSTPFDSMSQSNPVHMFTPYFFLKTQCNIVSPLCPATSQPPIWSPTMKFPGKKSLCNFSFPHTWYVELSSYQNTLKQIIKLFIFLRFISTHSLLGAFFSSTHNLCYSYSGRNPAWYPLA